jgi:hypothetical protein
MYPLDKVRLKLDRAQEHLATLDLEIVEFLKFQPYRVDPHPQTATFKIGNVSLPTSLPAPGIGIFRIVHEPPLHLSLIVGDYIHNVRSALDHLVWQLQLTTKIEPNERSQFPIFSKPNAGRLKEWTIDVPDKARDIIESLQPYHRANGPLRHNALWQIGKLDGIDKHATLIVTVLSEAIVSEEPDGTRIVNMFTNTLQDGDPVFADTTWSRQSSLYSRPDDKANVYIEPTYGVILEEAQGDIPRLTVPLSELGQFRDYVERRVLPRFTRFFK